VPALTCIWADVKCAAPGAPLRLCLLDPCAAFPALSRLMTSSPFWKAAISASVGGNFCIATDSFFECPHPDAAVHPQRGHHSTHALPCQPSPGLWCPRLCGRLIFQCARCAAADTRWPVTLPLVALEFTERKLSEPCSPCQPFPAL